ncbi:MAG: hypothetical protein E7593_02980 [Ruminococcaceae bacterium]|nr:hypothetical protein [Oscillospiraceae bacterium]
MKKTFKAILISAICVICLVCIFVFLAHAASDKTDVIYDISPFALKANTDQTLNNFTETNEGWDTDNSNADVTLSEKIDTFPYTPLTDTGCLIVYNKTAKSRERNYISKTYSTPVDMSKYDYLSLAVNCSTVEDSKYIIHIDIYSSRDVFSVDTEIDSACWNGVFVDISEWKNRSSVKKIKISVSYESNTTPVSGFEYYIDSIGLMSGTKAVNSVRFSAEDYSAIGGSLTYSDKNMVITSVNDELFLESMNFSYKSIDQANCLKIKFDSEGNCDRIKLVCTLADGSISGYSYCDVNTSGEGLVAYLPLSQNNIQSINLTFEGNNINSLTIHGIEPYSTYLNQDNGSGTIDTCAINPNTSEIIIKGNIDKDKFDQFSLNEILLFSHDLSESITSDTLIRSQEIAKSTVTSRGFIFRVSYDGDKDERLFLYKKYTVAIKIGNGYEIIGNSMCITNPESFSNNVTDTSTEKSGKGVYGQSISFMQEMGVSDTAIWVDIGKFFSKKEGTDNKFECGGNVYYYNADYARTIDNMINNYRDKNISVTLIFTISDTGNETLNRLLIHKDADLKATYCAYNTESRSALMYLRAFTEFWIEKHSSTISRVVFGNSVGLAKENYNMGDKTLEIFTEEYAKGFRIVYNAVKSYSANIGVYTYIDDNWDRDLPYDLYTRFDNRAFIDSFNRCVTQMGNIDWGLALNPYPAHVDDYFSYTDNTLNSSDETDRVSFKNLEVIVGYLRKTNILYSNSTRDFIIIEKSYFSNLEEKNITADYVYNSYRAMNLSVSAYITDRSCNYNNAMKYIDTSLSLSATHFAPDVLGASSWEGIIKGFSESNIIRTQITQSEIELTKADIKGSVVISDFSNNQHGWTRYGLTEKFTVGTNVSERSGLMTLSFGNIPNGESRGIVKKFDTPVDFSAMPILHFDVNVASLPTNVNHAVIKVVLVSSNSIFEITGSVNKASWTEIYCDFSEFSGKNKIEEIRILFVANENYYDSPQALISSIEALSYEYTSRQLENIVNPVSARDEILKNVKSYAYPVLTITLASAVFVFVWRRTSRKRRQN